MRRSLSLVPQVGIHYPLPLGDGPLHLPLPPKARAGRPRADDRKMQNGILDVLGTGCRWMDRPKKCGSSRTAGRRKAWEARRVWKERWRRLLDWGYPVGRLSVEGVGVDATTVEAQKGGRRWASMATVGGRGRKSMRSGRPRGCRWGSRGRRPGGTRRRSLPGFWGRSRWGAGPGPRKLPPMGPMTAVPCGRRSAVGASGPASPRIPGIAGGPGGAGHIASTRTRIGSCGGAVEHFLAWREGGFRRLMVRHERLRATFRAFVGLACFLITWKVLRRVHYQYSME